jgi:hypothetical protein
MGPPLREDFSNSSLAEDLSFIEKLAKILPKEGKNQKTRGRFNPPGLRLETSVPGSRADQ